MVRTTDFLSSDHVLKPLCGVPFVINCPDDANMVIYDILREKYNVNIYNEQELEKLRRLAYQYSPLSTQYRSTLHFTLNGLVSNHSKGVFDNRDFIIIDSLSNHQSDNIKSFRMEDTFIQGQFHISNSAVILIRETEYERLKSKYNWLDTYRIVLYKGNPKLATEIVLSELNIMPETIGAHSSEYTERTDLYQAYLNSLVNENMQNEKHIYSREYTEDDQKNLKLWSIFDEKFYNELLDYFQISEEEKEQLLKLFLSSIDINLKRQELKKFILRVGLENYMEFVMQYNRKILDDIQNGTFPSNDEILSGTEIHKTGETFTGATI